MVQAMKQTSLYITVLLTIAVVITLYPGNKMNQNSTPEKILQSLIEDHKTPSVQYVIFNSDRILYSYTNGLADVVNNRPANAQTTYHAFSVTKTFTALAVLQLAADEKLNIYDSVSTHLPNFLYGEQITIKNLLTHTSGIPNPIPLSWIHLAEDSEIFDITAFRERVIQINSKTRFSPNEKFAYSNCDICKPSNLLDGNTQKMI
jgi:D-alanyl-D-alanine carboxypeptidase